jgi:hypothetical protein
MTLVKARLIPIPEDMSAPPIEFMFNPTEITFQGQVQTSESTGARTQDKGKPKVSFSNVKAYKVIINKILFDTYETGEDVVVRYIEPLRKAVEFAAGKERPPIYTFVWGRQYLRRCFVETLTYKLIMFLPNGTPVRASIDSLTLKEADDPKPNGAVNPASPSSATRQGDTMASRSQSSSRA